MRVGYSVASLLLLTAVAAIFLAAVRAQLLDKGPPWDAAEPVAVIGLIGTFIAVMIGADLGEQRGRGGLGILAGLVFGCLSTFLLEVRDQYLVVAIGAPILVAFAAVVRWRSRSPLHELPKDLDEK